MLYIVTVFAAAITLLVFISYGNDYIDVKNNIKKSEEIENSTKLMLFNGNRSITGKNDSSDLSQIKMSVFSENAHSIKDRELLDNFQKAIEHLIINEDKSTPDCIEIAETKYISLDDCNFLKEQEYKAITFKNNQLGTKNEALLRIFENKNLSTEKEGLEKIDENSIFYIKNYNKEVMKSDRETFEKNLNFTNQLVESFKFFEDENELLDYGKAVFSTNKDRETLDVFTIYRLDLILNEISNIKYRKELKLAIDTKKAEEEIELLKNNHRANNTLHDNHKYFSNDEEFFKQRLQVIESNFN